MWVLIYILEGMTHVDFYIYSRLKSFIIFFNPYVNVIPEILEKITSIYRREIVSLLRQLDCSWLVLVIFVCIYLLAFVGKLRKFFFWKAWHSWVLFLLLEKKLRTLVDWIFFWFFQLKTAIMCYSSEKEKGENWKKSLWPKDYFVDFWIIDSYQYKSNR